MIVDQRYLPALREATQTLDRAAENLRFTLERVSNLIPITLAGLALISPADRERLDALAVRYSRCQQMVGSAFKSLALAEAEPQSRFIDLLALMQKRGLLESIDVWDRQRALRNDIGHLYLTSDNDFVDFYNTLARTAPDVIAYAQRMRQYALHVGINLDLM